MTGVSGVKSRKLWEVMDTITVPNHADIEFVVVVNTKWWNSLPKDTRGHIRDAAASRICPRVSFGRLFHHLVFTTTTNSISAWLGTVIVSITSQSFLDLTPETPVMPISTVPL